MTNSPAIIFGPVPFSGERNVRARCGPLDPVVFAKRVVEGAERVAVRVEHRFTMEEAVTGILAVHADKTRGIGELSPRRVRAMLRDVASGQAGESWRTGPNRQSLAGHVRAELIRIRLFSDATPPPHRYEYLAVPVEHQFTLAEAIAAVMAAKPMVRPAPGRRIVPLTAQEVRGALCFAARHGTTAEPVRYWRTETDRLARLADWTRDELVRLRVFSDPARAAPAG